MMIYKQKFRSGDTKATCTLALKHPWTEGLRNATSNTVPLHALVQQIDSSHYKHHMLSDWL